MSTRSVGQMEADGMSQYLMMRLIVPSKPNHPYIRNRVVSDSISVIYPIQKW